MKTIEHHTKTFLSSHLPVMREPTKHIKQLDQHASAPEELYVAYSLVFTEILHSVETAVKPSGMQTANAILLGLVNNIKTQPVEAFLKSSDLEELFESELGLKIKELAGRRPSSIERAGEALLLAAKLVTTQFDVVLPTLEGKFGEQAKAALSRGLAAIATMLSDLPVRLLGEVETAENLAATPEALLAKALTKTVQRSASSAYKNSKGRELGCTLIEALRDTALRAETMSAARLQHVPDAAARFELAQ